MGAHIGRLLDNINCRDPAPTAWLRAAEETLKRRQMLNKLLKTKVYRWFFSSLANQLLFTYLLIITISLVAVSLWALLTIKSESITDLQKSLEVEAVTLGLEIDNDLGLDSDAARERIQHAVERRATKLGAAITVVDRDGHVLADSAPEEKTLAGGAMPSTSSTERGNIANESEINDALAGIMAVVRRNERATNTNWLYVAYPIRSAGVTAGVIRVGVQLTEVEQRLKRDLIVFLEITLSTGVVTVLISLWLAERVTRPVKDMSKLAKEISVSGDLSSFLPVGRRDEIGELSLSFNQMIGRLREQERLRQEFVANASHELKTPVMAIGSVVDALMAGAAEDQTLRDKFLKSLEKLVDRQSRLIKDLLDISKLDSASDKYSQADVNLVQVISEALDEVRQQAQAKEIELQIPDWLENGNGYEFKVLGNNNELQRAFSNLLINAVNYTPNGGKVTVSTGDPDPSRVQIRIQDTGAGIAPNDLPHIFERFYRGEKSRTREAGGSGLGLAITHEIVVRHHGTIDVQSTLGKGSIFTVTLPMVQS